MKNILKKVLNSIGYDIKKFEKHIPPEIASDRRPVGSFKFLLEDLKQRGLNCKNILDVGANRAGWSRMAKEIYSEANFILIEPQVEMKEDLEKFCTEFKDSSYYLAGAGAKNNTLTLTIWDDLEGSSFLPAPNESLIGKGKQRQIEIITIDYLVYSKKIEIPELVKLDIQGFELEALKGAESTFGVTEVFILEVSLFPFNDVPGMPLISDVINFMLERDYVVYDFPGFLRRPLDGALSQCDICFVKKSGFLRKSNDWR